MPSGEPGTWHSEETGGGTDDGVDGGDGGDDDQSRYLAIVLVCPTASEQSILSFKYLNLHAKGTHVSPLAYKKAR